MSDEKGKVIDFANEGWTWNLMKSRIEPKRKYGKRAVSQAIKDVKREFVIIEDCIKRKELYDPDNYGFSWG